MVMNDGTPPELLASALRVDAARPLVTAYDGTLTGRTELSVATVANWVAKLGNSFLDEWGLDAGDEVAIDLPAHWAGVVTCLAAWSVGAEVVAPGSEAAAIIRRGPEPAFTGDELVLTLEPMGLDLSGLVASWPDQPMTTAVPAGAGAVAAARVLDLPAGARILSNLPFRGSDGGAAVFVAALAASGSVVLVDDPAVDATRLSHVAHVEGVTHSAGLRVGDLPRLP